MASYFVFVVFDDPRVVGVLDFLAETLNGKRWREPPHLTIQGPLQEKPTMASLGYIERVLGESPFLIANPGIFDTKKGAAVYLRVAQKNLDKVWNKPDFPVEKYGFNPHITLYDGPDVEMAKRAHDFLKSGKHRIELICDNYSVVPHAHRQLDMFSRKGVIGDEQAIQRLIGLGKVNSSFRASFMAQVGSNSRK